MDPTRPLPSSSQPSTHPGLFPPSTTSSSTSLTSALAQILSSVQNQSGNKLQALLNQQPSWSAQPLSSLPGSRLAQPGSTSLLPQHMLTPQSSGSPQQQVQHSAGSMQAIAQIHQALGNTPTRIPPAQPQHHLQASSPPHTQLTPSVANLMGAQAVALLNGGAGGSQMQQPQQGLAGRMSAMGSLRHAFNGGPNQSGPGEGSPSHLSLGSVSSLSGHPQGVSPVAQVLTHHTPHHSDLYTMSGSRKRGRSDSDTDDRVKKFHGLPTGSSGGSHSGKVPVADKLSKGLRHFSWRVCEKVQQKKVTTYNEVADELVREMAESEKSAMGTSEGAVDHKNIRRRVYDALNVLMAMNIISKEKKEIRWIGLPTNSLQECQHLEDQLAQCETRVKEKTAQLNELILQVLAFNNLIKRNKEEMAVNGPPPPNSAITLPFIIVHTDKDTYIDCSISTDKSEYVFHFDQPFAIHDDVDVLKKMGMAFGLESGTCSDEDLQRAKAMLPKAFEAFLSKLASQSQAQAASSGGGSSSQGAQMDSPFIDRRSISGPLGSPSPDVDTPTLASTNLVGSPIPSPIQPASTMIGNSPIVGSLGMNSPLLGSVSSFSKGSLPSLAGSPLSKVNRPPSPSMMGSPLARPLAGFSSPVKVSFGPTATTSPRPGGGGASKVLVQPVSSPSVKRVQAQVLSSSLGALSPLVRQLQTQGNFGSLSPQNILSCLSQADPNLLNIAQSLLTGGTSTGVLTSTQPTTTGIVASDCSAQAQSLLQVPSMQSQPTHLPPIIPPSSSGILPSVVDINSTTHSQLSMPSTAMSLLGQQQQDTTQQPGNV